MTVPAVSCLMVTSGRRSQAERSIDSYFSQTYPERELVIACDGHEDADHLRAYAKRHGTAAVTLQSFDKGTLSLGALRNTTVAMASGEFVCQWDDDDFYHPARLADHLEYVLHRGVDASFLGDQLHCFIPKRNLYWCDWTRPRFVTAWPEAAPNTLLCRRDVLPKYPETGPSALKGEDLLAMRMLIAAGRCGVLRGAGCLYMYVFHGSNTWNESHHTRIVRITAMDAGRLRDELTVIMKAVSEFKCGMRLTVRSWLDEIVGTVE